MLNNKPHRKLRLFSEQISMKSFHDRPSEFDPIFSIEVEQRINDWLDNKNIVHKTIEEHFRDFFQQNKENAQGQINLFINLNENASSSESYLSEIEFLSQNSSSMSNPNSLDLNKSPLLSRRKLNMSDFIPNKTFDVIQEFYH